MGLLVVFIPEVEIETQKKKIESNKTKRVVEWTNHNTRKYTLPMLGSGSGEICQRKMERGENTHSKGTIAREICKRVSFCLNCDSLESALAYY